MKIRTITTGLALKYGFNEKQLVKAAEFNRKAARYFKERGYEVQTTRIATNPYGQYTEKMDRNEIISLFILMNTICKENDVSFLGIGYSNNTEHVSLLKDINLNSDIISASSMITKGKSIDYGKISATSRLIKEISVNEINGNGNFRFAAIANCPPGIPFFPSAYHEGETGFGIGLESADILMKAFSLSSDLKEARVNFKNIYEGELKKIEAISSEIAEDNSIKYMGIDASINPSLSENGSIAFAFEKLSTGKFGSPMTLSIAAMVTSVIREMDIKLCGYSGLMLPICEDIGLARRSDEKAFGINDILLFSSVCGCGLDTIPLSGNISEETLSAMLLDVASLAIKLDKPLSARLLPIPNLKEGDRTSFNSPYLVDCNIIK
ncbi:MAG: DUF711 family protein [Candidatus Coatesbacteria bacterium]|nr:DUF711 family protein [Candidatus Coatesbacteria bacterium]